MGRTARDVMQTYLISVNPETPLLEVHRLFVDEEINGAPVVDETGRLLGVISSADLLRAVEEEHDAASSESSYLEDFLEISGADWQDGAESAAMKMAQESPRVASQKNSNEVKLSAISAKIGANRISISTPNRPPAADTVRDVPSERLSFPLRAS